MLKTFATAVSASALLSASASADIVDISGSIAHSTERSGSQFGGSLDYQHQGENSGRLVITLSNESPADLGGYITGFVFSIHSEDTSAVLVESTNAAFLSTGSEAAQPFGLYDAGAALGGNWSGGGSPKDGIAVGETDVFTFDINSPSAHALTARSFMEGPNEYGLVVRFRGLLDGGSDKVPVPAPATLALLGLGAVAVRRRR